MEKKEQGNILLLWVCVGFFMSLIVFLWFLNTKKVLIRANSQEDDETFVEIKEVFKEVKDKIGSVNDEIKKIKEEAVDKSEKIEQTNINKKSIEALKEKLEASSTDIIYDEK